MLMHRVFREKCSIFGTPGRRNHEYFPPNIGVRIQFIAILKAKYYSNIWTFLSKYFWILFFKNQRKYWNSRSFIFIFNWKIYFDNIINNYDNFMLVCNLLKTQGILTKHNFIFFVLQIIRKYSNKWITWTIQILFEHILLQK